MEKMVQGYKQRAPRFGIEPEMLKKSGVDLSTSVCTLLFKDGTDLVLGIQSIVNISTSGIKLTLTNPEQHALSGAGIELMVNAPGTGKMYTLKGDVCWSEHLTGSNSWIGVELKPRPDVLMLFTALTGETP